MALILILVMGGLLRAQVMKLGYVDTDRVLTQSNEIAEISRLFNLDIQNWRSQLNALDQEIRTMEQEYEIESLTRNEAAKREAQARIESKKQERQTFVDQYFGDGGRQEQRYMELMEPVTLKIQNIINKIAQDESYTMIFDTSYGVILYALPALDITEQVLLELNKDTVAPAEHQLPEHNLDPLKNEGMGFEEPKEDIKP